MAMNALSCRSPHKFQESVSADDEGQLIVRAFRVACDLQRGLMTVVPKRSCPRNAYLNQAVAVWQENALQEGSAAKVASCAKGSAKPRQIILTARCHTLSCLLACLTHALSQLGQQDWVMRLQLDLEPQPPSTSAKTPGLRSMQT